MAKKILKQPYGSNEFMAQIEGVSKIDYIVSQHAEQDHSGTIPQVLEKYPGAKIISTPKAIGNFVQGQGWPKF